MATQNSKNASDEQRPSEEHVTIDDGIELRSYANLFARHRALMLGTMAVVFLVGMAVTFSKRPTYRSTATILVTQDSDMRSDSNLPVLTTLESLTRGRSVDTQVELLSSRDLLENAYNQLSPSARNSAFGSIAFNPGFVKINNKKGTDIINIAVASHTPAVSAEFANRIADSYFRLVSQQDSDTTQQVLSYMENNMQQVEKELNATSALLAKTKQRFQLIAPSAQIDDNARQCSELQQALDQARAEYAASQQSLATLGQELSDQQPQVASESTISRNPRYQALEQALDAMRQERANLLQEYTPAAPPVQEIDARIAEATARLNSIANQQFDSAKSIRNPLRDEVSKNYLANLANQSALKARIQALDAALQNRIAQSADYPTREQAINKLSQHIQLLQNTYNMLSDRYYALSLSAQAKLPSGRLIARARPAEQRQESLPLYAMVFLTLGLVAGSVVVLSADRLQTARR